MTNEKPCLAIMPIGEAESETRKWSDQVLKHIIRPAAKECGYKVERADEIEESGMITSTVVRRLLTDPLVVADLTEGNPNVFYELAARHTIRKPCIQLLRKGERIPFDIQGSRIIHYDLRDLDSVEDAKQSLSKQIQHLENGEKDITNPISLPMDLLEMGESAQAESRAIADVVKSSLREIPLQLEELSERMGGGTANWSKSFAPYIIHDILDLVENFESEHLRIMLLASMCRDSFPWLYEIGMRAYANAIAGDEPGFLRCLRDFRRLADFLLGSDPRMKQHWTDKNLLKSLQQLRVITKAFDSCFPEIPVTVKAEIY